MIEEDAERRAGLAQLPRASLRALQRVLNAPEDYQDEVLRRPMTEPGARDMAQLIAMATTDKVTRLRVLRAIRDLDRHPESA